jgi:cytochrome c-type biogenesis protein CcmH/NrfG
VIWIAALAVIALAAAYFVGDSLRTRLLLMGVASLGVGVYLLVGSPGERDQPLSGRLNELERLAKTGADDMTPDQLMALLQKRAQDDPNDPTPHKFMGDLLQSAGRIDEAVMAYQSALRRDPGFQPALKSLADLLFKRSGMVDELTRDLYRAAFELDPSDVRLGFMAGLGDWQAGFKEEAEAEWARLEAPLAADDPRRQMFKAFRDVYTKPQAPEAGPPTAP